MKNYWKKFSKKRVFALLLMFIMVVSLFPVGNVEAASKTKLSKCKISGIKSSYTYTTKAVNPSVTVKYKGKKLKKNKDYKVKYSQNTNPGKATVTIQGKGKYTGSVKKSFQIKNGLTVNFSQKSYTYTGKDIKPSVTVKSGKKKLLAKEYSVSYKNNKAVGTATVIVKGKGKYKGKNALVTFVINESQKKEEGTGENGTPDTAPQPTPNPTPDTAPQPTPNPTPQPTNKYSLSETNISLEEYTSYSKHITIKGLTKENVDIQTSNSKVVNIGAEGDENNRWFSVNSQGRGTAVVTFTVHELGSDKVAQTLKLNVTVTPPTRIFIGNTTLYQGDAYSLQWDDSQNVQLGLSGGVNHSQVQWKSTDASVAKVTTYPSQILGGSQEIFVDCLKAGKVEIQGNYQGKTEYFELEILNIDDAYMSLDRNDDNHYETAKAESLTNTYGTKPAGILASSGLEKTLLTSAESSYGGFHHLGGMDQAKHDGSTYFALADQWNNRVLIFKGTSIEDATTRDPVSILGQSDAFTTTPGYSLSKMNYPMDCAFNPEKEGELIVADTHNHRLVIFEDVFTHADNGDKGYAAIYEYGWFTSNHAGNITHINTPWCITMVKDEQDGGEPKAKMLVSSIGNGTLLVWDNLPEEWTEYSNEEEGIYQKNYYPNMIVSSEKGSTPRAVTWTGQQLLVGDENIKTGETELGKSATRVYNGWPSVEYFTAKKVAGKNISTRTYGEEYLVDNVLEGVQVYHEYKTGAEDTDSQYWVCSEQPNQLEDFVYDKMYGEGSMIHGKLFLCYNCSMRVFGDGYINGVDDQGDYTAKRTVDEEYIGKGISAKQNGYFISAGGITETLYDEANDVLYVAAFNSCQLIGWKGPETKFDNSAPASSDDNYERSCPWPDIKVGQDNYEYRCEAAGNTGVNRAKIQLVHNPIPESDGSHLVVLDDLDQQLRIYKSIPYSDGALPDYSYSLPYETSDVDVYTAGGKTTMMLLSRTQNILYIWEDYNFDNPAAHPTKVLGKRIGSEYFVGEAVAVEYDGTYTYLTVGVNSAEQQSRGADAGLYKTLIYKGIPNKESNPIAIFYGIQEYRGQLSSNTDYFTINKDGSNIYIFSKEVLQGASEATPLQLNDSNAYGIVNNVEIGRKITTEADDFDPDYSKYGETAGCMNQKYSIYDYTCNDTTYKMHEKYLLETVYDAIVTPDGKFVAASYGQNRVVVFPTIDDAVNGTNPVVIGHSEKTYDTNDLLGVYDYHSQVGTTFDNTLYGPNRICYDGKNLWVGEFKWSGRLLRYRMVE